MVVLVFLPMWNNLLEVYESVFLLSRKISAEAKRSAGVDQCVMAFTSKVANHKLSLLSVEKGCGVMYDQISQPVSYVE
jgi:hypothetical protein